MTTLKLMSRSEISRLEISRKFGQFKNGCYIYLKYRWCLQFRGIFISAFRF